jgi:hypothetical protein
VTRPQVIEIPVKVYVPLDHALTDPLPPPSPPPARCHISLPAGDVPAVCALDGLAWIEQWEALRERANADRAAAAQAGGKAAPHD